MAPGPKPKIKPRHVPAVPAPKKLTTPAFPAAYPDFFANDPDLDKALADAIKGGPGNNWPTAVAIVALNSDGTRPMASFRPNEVHFAASLVKIVAMYAAYELLRTMNQLSQEYGKAAKAAFLKDAAAYLDRLIMAKAASIPPLKGLQKAHAVPSYSINYEGTPDANGILKLSLTSGYDHNLLQMIEVSSDTDAAWCIHRTGYGYINGALTSAGFFNGTKNGIWLAGDYLDKEDGTIHKWPYFRIDSVNDKGVAQALTVAKTAKLITLIADRKLAGSDGSDGMLKLMKAAADHPEVYITRTPGLDFKVTHNKLGWAFRKPPLNDKVFSEGSIIEHNSGMRFVVVWQNYYVTDNAHPFKVISWVIDNALLAYATYVQSRTAHP